MAAENFDIVFRVIDGKVATAQIGEVTAATEDAGAAQVVASKRVGGANRAWVKHAAVLGGLYGGYKLLKSSLGTTMQLTRNTLAFQRATGMDMKTSQAWVVTAEHRGISTKQLQTSMATLGRQLGGVTPATKASASAFKVLGVSQASLLHMNPEARMEALASAFHRLPNGINQAAIAQKLFGRAGQGLLPILKGGAEGMREQIGEAEKLVPPVAKNTKAAIALMAAQRRWQAISMGLQVTIGTALLPVLTTFATVLTPIAQGFSQMMRSSSLFRYAILILTSAITGLLIATKIIIPTLRALGFAELAAEAPISIWAVAIAAVGAAFYLAYTHIKWFRNAVDAVVGFVKGNWRTIITGMATVLLGPLGGALVLVATHFHTFERVASSVISHVKSIIGSIVGFIKSLPSKIASAASGMFNGVFNAAWHIVQSIGRMFANLGSTIVNKIKSAGSSAVHFLSGGLLGHAEGGPITQTGPAIVGERGPEIVTLTKGQYVVPNHQLASMGGGGGTVHTHVYLDRKQIALAVGRYTSDQQKRR